VPARLPGFLFLSPRHVLRNPVSKAAAKLWRMVGQPRRSWKYRRLLPRQIEPSTAQIGKLALQ